MYKIEIMFKNGKSLKLHVEECFVSNIDGKITDVECITKKDVNLPYINVKEIVYI